MKKNPFLSWALRLGTVAIVSVLTGEISSYAQQANAEQNANNQVHANAINGNSIKHANSNGTSKSSGFDTYGNNSNSSSGDHSGDDASSPNTSGSSASSGSSSPTISSGFAQHSRYTRTGGS